LFATSRPFWAYFGFRVFDFPSRVRAFNREGRKGKAAKLAKKLKSIRCHVIFISCSEDLYHNICMAFPIKVCAVCGDEFELKPGKPGFANRCLACSEPESAEPASKRGMDADERKSQKEANEARRQAMRNLLYRKDS
jgi:hypothetical protein